MNAWIDRYDRKHRPGQSELAAHLPAGVMALFSEFAGHLARAYGLHCAPATYTVGRGWVFSFGRTGLYLIEGVAIGDDAFRVGDIQVGDEPSLAQAIAYADRLYADGFAKRFAAHSAQKSAKQAENTRRRREREQRELEAMAAKVDPERFNKYRWSPKVPRRSLTRIYESDARGLEDEELADEIGYALYARCLQGRDERALIESGKLRCHGCGETLGVRSYNGLIECACGRQFIFRYYMRSFRTNNMPSGSATHIFNDFIDAWPRAAGYAAKMRLIDGLVHEYHINLVTGVKGRFVGINLIEGTKKQIEKLILSLAAGPEGDASKEQFKRNLQRL